MATYVISCHGEADFNSKTDVPAGVGVTFYTPFGQCLSNADGFRLQTALAHPGDPRSPAVLQSFPGRARWNGPVNVKPALSLTADWHGDFKSGILHVETGTIIEVIGTNKLLTLTGALGIISRHAVTLGVYAEVHFLFCLA